ncbi:MAG: peptidase S41 [Anaerolineae bacterium]|nr:MAG: peptidase S41 [Anaerolineae bacterium]WKZ42813.1 MAG: S41 family peptidase [Anaerolineales bacterium]
MKSKISSGSALLIALSMILSACAPKATATPTPVATEEPVQVEEGPKTVTGTVTYTNPFFTEGVAQPIVILEDQGGFVTRDRNFIIPVESQVIATITSDFYTSPFTYSLSLPDEPNGTLRDVDHDGAKETGVMVFAVAYWTNTWGDPFLEKRDQGGGGWSSAYASTKVSDDRDSYLEVYGGKYLVYAPDDKQQFPSSFGADKKLFTDDDPVMDLPAGWSVVDLDKTPFEIDRSENPTLELYEPESAALDDFSALSYTEAFDKMVEKFKNEYAFTELKKIDWDAKAKEFRPAFEAAEKAKDPHAYALALRDFVWSIPDTHVGFDQTLVNEDFQNETAGGIGFAMRETDDGKIIANFILDGGPADEAGMEWGAEIVSFDGTPVADVVEATVPWSSPFSNPINKRLQQLRYATRFRLDKGEVEVVFKNPGGAEKTATLPVVGERDSFTVSSFYAGTSPTELPVEFDVLPSGYGYIKVNSFLDNDVLSIQVWERAIKYFNDNGIPGVILDLRINGGGSGWLADQMAAYFFNEDTLVGNTAFYDDSTGEFYMDPGDETYMIPPREDLQYNGTVVVMVGPACASACEFFSYNMTVNDRATIVGFYPSDGAGGSVEQFLMPEDVTVQLTIGRAVDAEGNIHLEGKGVEPDVKVPVTVENLQRLANGEDVVLEIAEKVVSQPAGAGVTPSGPPKMASKAEAASAFASGNRFLEEAAREEYQSADYANPGVLTFTVPLIKDESFVWMYAWCTTSTEVLNQNFQNIKLKFMMDGEEVPLDQLVNEDLASGGQQCRLYYTALSNWPAGEHHLSITATFTESINDGTSDYEAGEYVLNYDVFMKP